MNMSDTPRASRARGGSETSGSASVGRGERPLTSRPYFFGNSLCSFLGASVPTSGWDFAKREACSLRLRGGFPL